jgi:hypothetical protein
MVAPICEAQPSFKLWNWLHNKTCYQLSPDGSFAAGNMPNEKGGVGKTFETES